MSNIPRASRSWRRSLGYLGLFGVATIAVSNTAFRYRDRIQGTDTFSQHTHQQQKKHPFSGMHEPFITNNSRQLEIFQKHFPQYSFLVPENIEVMKEKHALKTQVKIKPLSECPIKTELSSNEKHIVVVGGPPALVTGVSMIKTEQPMTYLNDERRIPIAFGSAWHLEQDAATEAPTTYRPTQFLISQIKRAVFGYVSHMSVEETGLFPWRTLDWVGWIRHPEHWISGFKVLLGFQWFTMFGDRKATLKSVASQCVENEKFFNRLNGEFDGKLLMQSNGCILIARTEQEIADLNALKDALTAEGRILHFVSKEEMLSRYGFVPNALCFADKVHDRIIVPNFMKLFNNYIEQHGGKVIDGTLTTIYTDVKKPGGVVEYQTSSGQKHFIEFSRLILSLGSQPILKENNKPLFDIVAARGVSILAHVYLPTGYKLPSSIICGDTNNAINLTENPVTIENEDGKPWDLYLMRFTAGACITPNVSDATTANYDGTIGIGLVSAVRNMFGNQCKIEPIMAYGCNRQVSRNGEIRWIEPFPGIHVQYGAGGGGITRSPDYVAKS